MLNKLAWPRECKKASTVWPDKVRPLASVMVPEIIISKRPFCSFPAAFNSSSYFLIAKMAALAFSVSKMVSINKASTPPSTKPRTCS